ncbi:MAG: 16S rRNA (guanine(966)-N(2))-methyltransferase RsmD [Chloroflexi bacterium]|nr:16S rRNA (guanine(966)-N(2))-methyltransferase RsmD [Chloroflexota bacterium]
MSPIRVISGIARGRKLRKVPGGKTRPITDRVKEAVFNIIGSDIVDSKMLDLFAGTGSVGIEALSRGANYVRFVDRNGQAIKTVRENLTKTGLNDEAEILQMDAFTFLNRQNDLTFDYVYIAPPQYLGLWKKALIVLDANPGWLVEDAWVIAQIDPREYEKLPLENLSEFDQRKYGNTELVFYEHKQVEND